MEKPLKVYVLVLNNGEEGPDYFEWVNGVFYDRKDAARSGEAFGHGFTIEEWEVK